ncbi:hypothetical protein MBLNU230_g3050t1 [Neophaeotheca triangularis]
MASLNYVSFNQDHSQLSVATSRGLRLYNVDPWDLTTHTYEEDISLVEQLFSTSLVAIILTPRLLRIINTKRHSTICELSFHSMVVAIKMNRKRLVVVSEEAVYIYDISNMKMVHTQLIPSNPYGICALSASSERNYLALPHYQKSAPNPQTQTTHVPKSVTREAISGDVLLYDVNNLEEVTVIPAHQTPLSCIAINSEGTLLATASEKGTVIRIFSLPDSKTLHQFRRGSMPARIYSMSFNATSTLLVVSSATETVHVFKLTGPGATNSTQQTPRPSSHDTGASSPSSPHGRSTSGSSFSRDRSTSPSTSDPDPYSPSSPPSDPDPPVPTKAPRNPGLMSMMRRTSQNVSTSLVSRAAGYLPSSVTEMWEPQRDFAWVRVPRSNATGQPARCVVAMGNNSPQVMVATNEGDFYVYSVDLEKGGEGTLVRHYE